MVAINSHIQITRALLDKFSHKTKEGRKVYFLDLTDNQIKEEKTRLLGAKLGYYSEDVERFLGTIERGFGEATKRIIKSIQQNSDVFELTEKDILYIKYFFHYMLIRSNYFLSIVREGRIFAKIFNGFYTTNNIIRFTEDFEGSPFNQCYVNLLKNVSNTEFVIPKNCYYNMITEKDGHRGYVLPITPQIAILLLKGEPDIDQNGRIMRLRIDKDEVARSFNNAALACERYYNNDFIVAKHRETLEELEGK